MVYSENQSPLKVDAYQLPGCYYLHFTEANRTTISSRNPRLAVRSLCYWLNGDYKPELVAKVPELEERSEAKPVSEIMLMEMKALLDIEQSEREFRERESKMPWNIIRSFLHPLQPA